MKVGLLIILIICILNKMSISTSYKTLDNKAMYMCYYNACPIVDMLGLSMVFGAAEAGFEPFGGGVVVRSRAVFISDAIVTFVTVESELMFTQKCICWTLEVHNTCKD